MNYDHELQIDKGCDKGCDKVHGERPPEPMSHSIDPSQVGVSVAQAKARLRTAMRQKLKELAPDHRRHASEQVCERLRQQEIWRQARSIAFFAPRADELDIRCLLEEALAQGKVVGLPQYQPQSRTYRACQVTTPLSALSPGAFGILEPDAQSPVLAINQLDLVLVPGVAFDRSGRRLGHGRGFYDLLLADVQGLKCGLAFDEQVLDYIPVEAHDVLLDCIVTPRCWLNCRLRRYGDDMVGQ